MNSKIIAFLSIFLTLYGLCSYYVGLRGYQAFTILSSSKQPATYWAITVFLLALSFPLSHFVVDCLPHSLNKVLNYVSSYWLAALYYLILIFALGDLIRVVFRGSEMLPASLRGNYHFVIIGILFVVTLLLIYGTWNARHPVVRNYDISIPKKSSIMENMQVVVVSDVHLGWIVGIDRLRQMAGLINSLQPDLILLPGDIIDEGVDLANEQAIPAVLRTMQPRLGTFAAMGNHEYISGNAEKAIEFLGQAGITVLCDQAVEIADGFYLVGRDNASRHRFCGSPRLTLSDVMDGVDIKRLPLILMDHEPSQLNEAAKAGVDLQFSGHTHQGQMFPNNYITAAIFEQDWGYLRKNNFQLLVSCGYGTWGPPIRIGNRPEILNVKVTFTDLPFNPI